MPGLSCVQLRNGQFYQQSSSKAAAKQQQSSSKAKRKQNNAARNSRRFRLFFGAATCRENIDADSQATGRIGTSLHSEAVFQGVGGWCCLYA